MKRCVLIILCMAASCMFLGCSQGSIKFSRESQADAVIQDITKSRQQTSVKKDKSGVFIYKDTTTTDTTGGRSGFIGPKDINFDMNFNFMK